MIVRFTIGATARRRLASGGAAIIVGAAVRAIPDGGSGAPARDIPVFAQWWREGRLPVDALVSSRIGLDDVNRAMDELAAGTALRQVIEF